jgi:hypothetical protein
MYSTPSRTTAAYDPRGRNGANRITAFASDAAHTFPATVTRAHRPGRARNRAATANQSTSGRP